MEVFLALILGIGIGGIYFVAVMAVGGYTLSTLWNDFIPQIFPSLPHLNFYQALALSLVVGLFTKESNFESSKNDDDSTATSVMKILAPFIRYGFALLIGMWLKSHIGQ